MYFLSCKVSLKVFFGKPGPWFEEADQDGDKNSIFHDVDGSVTGFKDTYVGRMDNYLIRHPDCSNFITWNGVVCSGTFAQVKREMRMLCCMHSVSDFLEEKVELLICIYI